MKRSLEFDRCRHYDMTYMKAKRTAATYQYMLIQAHILSLRYYMQIICRVYFSAFLTLLQRQSPAELFHTSVAASRSSYLRTAHSVSGFIIVIIIFGKTVIFRASVCYVLQSHRQSIGVFREFDAHKAMRHDLAIHTQIPGPIQKCLVVVGTTHQCTALNG